MADFCRTEEIATEAELRKLFDMEPDEEMRSQYQVCAGAWLYDGEGTWRFFADQEWLHRGSEMSELDEKAFAAAMIASAKTQDDYYTLGPKIDAAIRAYLAAAPAPTRAEVLGRSSEILRLVQYHVTDDDDRYTLTAALNALCAKPDSSPALEMLDEGLEILSGLIDNIKKRGNYSPESTCVFIDQAGSAFREARRALAGEKP